MSSTGTPVTSPFQQFEQNLVAFFEGVKDKVVEFANAFLPAVENDLEIAFEDLASIAGQAVMTEATKIAAGTEKFGNAVANVVQTVEASGKTVAIQTAQSAVQQAYLTAQQIAQTATQAPATGS